MYHPYYSFTSGGAVTPPVVPVLISGGIGHKKWTREELEEKLKELELESVREAYNKILEIAPPSVQREAASIVKPFARDQRKIPVKIDWKAMNNSLYRFHQLLDIYEEEVFEREDEDFLLMDG